MMDQLTYDNQAPDDSDDSARMDYIAKELTVFAENHDYDGIDQYVVDLQIDDIVWSDVQEFLRYSSKRKNEARAYLDHENSGQYAELLMNDYVQYLLNPMYFVEA